MKKLFIVLVIVLLGSHAYSQVKTKSSHLLDGEWIVQTDWRERFLTFSSFDKNLVEPESYSIVNTIRFEENGKILVSTYGTFGCGTSAVQNLRMHDVSWSMENDKIRIKGSYRNYLGVQDIDRLYEIIREDTILKLTSY